MLTSQDLAVLRAAVTYFAEELGPHGAESMRPYFVEPIPEEWSPRDLTRLREFLTTCQLRYIACNTSVEDVIEATLSGSVSELLKRVTTPSIRVGTVLLAPNERTFRS